MATLLVHGVDKCFDDRRSLRLWLTIPEILMNNNPEIKTHAYMQVSITPKNQENASDDLYENAKFII
jgi:hypothetical protein